MAEDRAYRDALARYPTGVAVVTAFDGAAAKGVTVNSFASVSLKPRLILWSVGLESDRRPLFSAAERFAVNMLAADQAALASALAKQDDLAAAGADWTAGDHGAPLIAGAIARLECARYAVYPGGDHEIILGEVLAFDAAREAPALVFHRSDYAKAG